MLSSLAWSMSLYTSIIVFVKTSVCQCWFDYRHHCLLPYRPSRQPGRRRRSRSHENCITTSDMGAWRVQSGVSKARTRTSRGPEPERGPPVLALSAACSELA
ncbi:hypothetical protein F4780DRAFT_747366 [Xylariomycetidae sp. FL0641]|nr:hypothetical protein F4780DRAFT_747366 [Xylariomycetidae sp. FL0641]